MTTEVYWLVPERVIYLRVTGVLTVAEIAETNRRNIALLATITHDLPIHFIDDNREMTKAPTNLGEVRAANKEFAEHPKAGWWVIIDTSRMVRFMTAVVSQINRKSVKATATWEDVVAFFPHVDATLPPLPSAPPTGEPLFRV